MSEQLNKFNDLNFSKIFVLQKKIDSYIAQCSYLEEFTQKITETFYNEFKNSVILARAFITVPFSELPKNNKVFIQNLAKEKEITASIQDNTPILSLIGTYGIDASWNDRHNSKGHLGIPLVSKEFIELIPMISRLLKSFGLPLGWVSGTDTGIVTNLIGDSTGIFYVPDAKTTKDEKERNIISNKEFVDKYNIKTVFGFGGSYLIERTFVVFIIFTCEEIEKCKADLFMPISNLIKDSTTQFVSKGMIFSEK